MGVQGFNRACYTAALVWVLGVAGTASLSKPRHPDIAQYYMGGAMILRERGADLYPVPVAGAKKNAGFTDSSRLRPLYERIALEQRIAEFNRFVYTPPAALAFAPLALLDYRGARAVWVVAMCLCGWGVALAAASIHARVRGRPGRADGMICMAVAASPLMFLTLRSGNITPAIALALALSMLALHAGKVVTGTAALAAGGIFKGTSAALLPLVVGLGRWRQLVALSLGTAAVLLATVLWIGTEPFHVFFEEIAPTLSRSTASSANQSLAGAWLRATGSDALPPVWGTGLRACGAAALVGSTAVVALRARSLRASSACFFAACAGLVSLVLVLSPLVWAHYHLYAAPLWGWAVLEGRRSRLDACLAWGSIGLAFAPVCVFDPPGAGVFGEALRAHMLLGALCTLTLAARRLVRPGLRADLLRERD